jgi:AraC family transcriptional regulator, regulatory protein of adaptative response / DNA-3-methyladenine glycosylase II
MDLDHDACYRAISQRDVRFDGRLFIGVKTTGIYCRPVCPARTPRSENVNFYPTAAAAQEAGFRPCLRCRPETAPDMGAWRGTSNTVSRALGLIELGALDAADVDALANRLGVGERQLRRLFRQHLGASPVAVAQTRRVLLAKQLIHETRLPMTEIAFAAGFGSVRRFNETFQTLFDRAPGALRRASGPEISAGARGEVSLLLRYQPPYDWAAMLRFMQAHAIPGVESIAGDSYSRTIELDGVQGMATVRPADGNALRATIRFARLSALPAIIARLRRVFDLAADPVAIAAHLAEDPALAPLVAARPGLRAPGAWDGFELAVRVVLERRSAAPAAAHLAGRIAAAYGAPTSERHGDLAVTFPQPQVLAAADLTALGVAKGRAAAISAIAAAMVADPHFFGAHRGLEETAERLRSIRGMGEAMAQYIAARLLREPDAFSSADPDVARALADSEGRTPGHTEILARAELWRPWRAYAAQHLSSAA